MIIHEFAYRAKRLEAQVKTIRKRNDVINTKSEESVVKLQKY